MNLPFFKVLLLLTLILGFVSSGKTMKAACEKEEIMEISNATDFCLGFKIQAISALHQTKIMESDYISNVVCLFDVDAKKNESAIPPRFDWREKNILTPVKHQMNLGSCGVFSAVAVFEALIKKNTHKDVDLSEQHIINASTDWVPSGISAVDAMKFMKDNGIVLEESLPYEDKKTDKKPAQSFKYRLQEYHYVITDKMPLAEKISTIQKAVYQHGPVATNMIFYEDLDRYKGGIYMYDGKSKEQGGHWVVIIGWRDDSKIKNGGYWICRNSWGSTWGKNGYFKIAYGECGIDNFWFVYGVFE